MTCLSSFSYSPLSMYSSAVRWGVISFAMIRLTLFRFGASPRKIKSNKSRWYWEMMLSTIDDESCWTSTSNRATVESAGPGRLGQKCALARPSESHQGGAS